jgi:CheY-like chemotaxis protein
VGRGSMFAFEVLLGVATETRAQPITVRVANLRGVFALVIDDEDDARAGMCGLLESWGCLTLAAAGGDRAIAGLAAHDRPPELIVCDYRLAADEDGLDAIAHIRAAVGEEVPAILVTADTGATTLRASGVPVLHKPVSPVKLRALLAQLLTARETKHAA